MSRVTNFNAGPAALPLPVLERAQKELVEYAQSGMSIMEHSHRGKEYEEVHDSAIALLRDLLGIPDRYYVLFMQGGASQQFAMLPMNFLPAGKSADYVLTGHWSERAYEEARLVGTARVAGTTKTGKTYSRIPTQAEISVDAQAAYVHITTNNTIFGTQWQFEPDVGQVPLVADMSSDFMWRNFDVNRYALIYAGAQKNLGPSGVVVVVARKDWVDAGRSDLPTIFRYSTFAANNSLYNTPPTFAIYLCRHVLAWVKEIGGLGEMERRNREKGRALYGAIDENPEYYRAPVDKSSRSLMNVVFRLPSEELEDKFVKEAARAGMVGLKGHRSVGGVRASIYNAVSVEDVRKLADFMREFARR